MIKIYNLLKLFQQKKDFVWLILGQIISLIFGFFVIKLITKIGSAQFGVYSLILTISALISSIFVGPSEQGFVRYFFSFRGIENKKRILNVIYLFSIAVFTIILFFTILSFFLKININTNLLIVGVFIYLFTFSNFFISLFNLIKKRRLNTLIIILEKIILTILLYLLYNSNLLNITTVLLSICLSVLTGLILRINSFNKLFEYNFFQNIKLIGSREYVIYKYVFIFSIPLIVWGFAGWLSSNGDRWIIAHFTNLQTVGIYSLMMALSSYLIATPIGVVGQYFQPIIFENINTSNRISKKYINEFLLTCLVIIIIGTFFSIFFGKITISFISINFNAFWYFLPLFTISVGLFQIAQAYTIIGIIHEKPGIYLFSKILLGIISSILNIIGIYYFQIIGLAISLIISNLIYLLMILTVNNKLLNRIK
jgi:O-antigen/teichoic acid export membrane protein